jgi:hypothetical protein
MSTVYLDFSQEVDQVTHRSVYHFQDFSNGTKHNFKVGSQSVI